MIYGYFISGGLLFAVIMVASMWAIFEKAERPGWFVFIPIYNLYVLLEMADHPWWWLFLFLIPPVAFIVYIIEEIDIAHKFGKGNWFAAGLVFLPVIFFPIMALDSSKYKGEIPLNVFAA